MRFKLFSPFLIATILLSSCLNTSGLKSAGKNEYVDIGLKENTLLE